MSRLPVVARLLLGVQVPALHREAFLGDLEEEFSRRLCHSRAHAGRWLWWQVLSGFYLWSSFRSQRSRALVELGPVLLGLAAASVCVVLLNTAPALQAARTLPAALKPGALSFLNLLSVAAGGWLLGALDPNGRRRSLALLLILVAALPSALYKLETGQPWSSVVDTTASIDWMAALALATALGWRLGRTRSDGNPLPESDSGSPGRY